MLDSRIEHINATLAELTELMQLVSESYPEVPAILCKISLEKGESLCEELRALNTVKETIPMVEQTAEKVESGEASLLVYENAERNDIPMCDTVSKENKEYGESFSHSEEKDIPDVETSFVFLIGFPKCRILKEPMIFYRNRIVRFLGNLRVRKRVGKKKIFHCSIKSWPEIRKMPYLPKKRKAILCRNIIARR